MFLKTIGLQNEFYEINEFLGDATKARTMLGWKPTTTFDQLVAEMVQTDIETMKQNPNA